jgi:hypothetical protein
VDDSILEEPWRLVVQQMNFDLLPVQRLAHNFQHNIKQTLTRNHDDEKFITHGYRGEGKYHY